MPDFLTLKNMKISLNGKTIEVNIGDYVEAKTKDLIAFGYSTLTEESVLNSVRRILNKEKLVDVIDRFVEDDIVLEEETK
jgi:hypothetical protein